MKKIFISSLLLLLVTNISAQWYTRTYGVSSINELSKSQLEVALQHAQQKVKMGQTFTFLGIGGIVVGGIIVGTATNNETSWEGFWDSIAQMGLGYLVGIAGAGFTAVGIPIWIISANRKNSIEVALVKFNTSSNLRFNKSTVLANKLIPKTIGVSINISI